MTMAIHVLPDRRGGWAVREEGTVQPLSVHVSATAAERAARERARAVGASVITVHDVYARVRVAAVDRQVRPAPARQ
jgi:hypothetical protein